MNKLEEGISPVMDSQTAALTSIAISLKRIADNMERVEITGEPQGFINPDAPDYLARIDELAKGGLRK